jgi:hypothetical protein
MTKRYDVMAPRAKKDGGTFWVRIGTAFDGEKGIGIEFDALPLPDKDGRVSVRLFEPRERTAAVAQPAPDYPNYRTAPDFEDTPF